MVGLLRLAIQLMSRETMANTGGWGKSHSHCIVWHGQGSSYILLSQHIVSGEPSPAETNDIEEACILAKTNDIHVLRYRLYQMT